MQSKALGIDQLKSDRGDLYEKVKNQKQILMNLKADFKEKSSLIKDMAEKRSDVQNEMQYK